MIEIFKNTSLNDSIKCLLITYNGLIDLNVPKGNLFAHKVVYKSYFDTNERRKDVSLLCKFILTKYLIGENADPFGILAKNKKDDILHDDSKSSITAMWLPILADYNLVDTNFSDFIWHYNIRHLPFIVKPDSMKKEAQNFKKNRMNDLKTKFNLHFERFKEISLLTYFDRYVGEVFMGFIARLQYLTVKTIEQEERHEGEIAESTLRIIYEARVKFLWLNMSQSSEAMQQYREYKVGREKLFLDRFNEEQKKHEGFDDYFNELKKTFQQHMKTEGVDDYKIAVEKGDSFEKDIKQMADDLGGNEPLYYFTVYKRTSDVIHGNWRIIERYHLERSLNPAHNDLLRYSSTPNTYAGLLPSYLALIFSTDLLIKFIELYEPLMKGNKLTYNSLRRFYMQLNKKYIKEFGIGKMDLKRKDEKHKTNTK